MSRGPIIWEEDERYQRGMARLISTLTILWVFGYGTYCIRTRDWVALQWLGWVVGVLAAGFAAWSIVVLVFAWGGTGTANLVRNWRSRRDGAIGKGDA